MIEIRVSTAEEQQAVGVALAHGAMGFGNWPYKVTRAWPRSAGSAGASSGGNASSAGAAGRARPGSSATAGVNADTPGNGGGAAGTSQREDCVFIEDLRSCCATQAAASHRHGCEQAAPG